MTDGPNDIRIDDLKAPVLTPMQQMVVDGFAGTKIEFTEDAGAWGGAGAHWAFGFRSRRFSRAPLACGAKRQPRTLTSRQWDRLASFGDMTRYASNRLRFHDLLKRHPEILDVEIRKPIIIAGLPRSGTTHLLNLIAADTRLRSLPYWESLEPIPDANVAPGPKEQDPRYVKSVGEYQMFGQIAPLLKNMHDMAPDHVHEEIELGALDFSTFLPEWLAVVPRWRDYYHSHDQRPHYAYMKNVLKALQWMRGPERWILKSPQHLEQLGPLIETFPDATVALTHRDPVSGGRVRHHDVDVRGPIATDPGRPACGGGLLERPS